MLFQNVILCESSLTIHKHYVLSWMKTITFLLKVVIKDTKEEINELRQSSLTFTITMITK